MAVTSKFIQIKDGAGNILYPNLNLSPFNDQFFTTSTIGGRGRITLSDSAIRAAQEADIQNVQKNQQPNSHGRMGRVATVGHEILQSMVSAAKTGTWTSQMQYVSEAMWIVPTARGVASTLATLQPNSATYATSCIWADSAGKLGGRTEGQLYVAHANTADTAGTAGTATTAGSAMTAGTAIYADNGGVTKIKKGTNVTISPADGLGEVTINAAGATSADVSAILKGLTGYDRGKILRVSTNTNGDLCWGDDNTGGTTAGVTYITAGYGISVTANTGYVTIANTMPYTGQGGTTVNVHLAEYAGSCGQDGACPCSAAGVVGTLCFQNLSNMFSAWYENPSIGAGRYAAWDNSYTVPSAAAVVELLCVIIHALHPSSYLPTT